MPEKRNESEDVLPTAKMLRFVVFSGEGKGKDEIDLTKTKSVDLTPYEGDFIDIRFEGTVTNPKSNSNDTNVYAALGFQFWEGSDDGWKPFQQYDGNSGQFLTIGPGKSGKVFLHITDYLVKQIGNIDEKDGAKFRVVINVNGPEGETILDKEAFCYLLCKSR